MRFSGETPVFVQIRAILFPPGHLHPFLVGDRLQTICYNEHFHAYEVATLPAVDIFVQSDLVDHHILSLYQPFNDHTTFMLPLKYYVLDEYDV